MRKIKWEIYQTTRSGVVTKLNRERERERVQAKLPR